MSHDRRHYRPRENGFIRRSKKQQPHYCVLSVNLSYRPTGVEKDVDVGNFVFVPGFLKGVKFNFLFTRSLTHWTAWPAMGRCALDVAITSHVPSSICNEPDIDLQLADPGLSGTTFRTFPLRSVIRSVTGTGVDSQMKCFMRWYWFLQTT